MLTDDQILEIAMPYIISMGGHWETEKGIHEEAIEEFARDIEKAVLESEGKMKNTTDCREHILGQIRGLFEILYQRTCAWENRGEKWHTGCEYTFAADPNESDIQYCPYCGGKII